MTTGYVTVLSLALPAAVTNGISTSQSPGGAGNLTITGSLATGGIASLVTAQRVGIHSASDDTGRTFTVYGTDRYGRTQSESFLGANTGTANSTKDFLTVTRIAVDAATAGAVYAGTVAVGSTAPLIFDRFVNPANCNVALVFSGTANAGIDVSLDDLAPAWDLTSNSPTWFTPTVLASKSSNTLGQEVGPFTMMRLTVNSGTGTVTATIVTPLAGSS